MDGLGGYAKVTNGSELSIALLHVIDVSDSTAAMTFDTAVVCFFLRAKT